MLSPNFSDKSLYIESCPDFPFYIANGTEEEKNLDFYNAIITLKESYIQSDRSMHLNEVFWHSVLITQKREYASEVNPKKFTTKKETRIRSRYFLLLIF